MIQKETPSLILGPSRKSRTKIRKPKFLSLRLALFPESTQHSGKMPADHHHQLNLFPLHPENLVEDHKDTHDDDVAYFFSAADGGATTLTGLLGGGTASPSASDVDSSNNVTNPTTTLSTPESLTCAYGGQDRGEGDQQLVRTAMRNKERDPTSEEKWVCYSEVTNSSGGVSVSDLRWKSDEEKMMQRQKRLSLKLDYEEIMNVWCDTIIHLEYSCSSSSQPQVVPDFHDDDLFGRPTTSNDWETRGLRRVPEMSGSNSKGCIKMEEVQGEECKMAQREASVLRYKEKRQNRLFFKKIRYQVRKLNAEKRPRIKGRFVKR